MFPIPISIDLPISIEHFCLHSQWVVFREGSLEKAIQGREVVEPLNISHSPFTLRHEPWAFQQSPFNRSLELYHRAHQVQQGIHQIAQQVIGMMVTKSSLTIRLLSLILMLLIPFTFDLLECSVRWWEWMNGRVAPRPRGVGARIISICWGSLRNVTAP